MSTTLNEMLNSSDPPELVDPIELTHDEVHGKELIATCLLGIFNPMGPTIIALNLVAQEGKPSVAVLYTSLNPFSQTRQLIARAPSDPESVMKILESSYQVGDDYILGSWPTLFLPVTEIPAMRNALQQMVLGLLNAVPSGEPVAKVLADLKKHLGNPWGRIPSFEEMLSRAKGMSDASEESMSDKDFADWMSLMTDKDHAVNEFQAIIQAWGLSIENFGAGLSHMPLEEMDAELSGVCSPFLK
jgi:hypothetical protein